MPSSGIPIVEAHDLGKLTRDSLEYGRGAS